MSAASWSPHTDPDLAEEAQIAALANGFTGEVWEIMDGWRWTIYTAAAEGTGGEAEDEATAKAEAEAEAQACQ